MRFEVIGPPQYIALQQLFFPRGLIYIPHLFLHAADAIIATSGVALFSSLRYPVIQVQTRLKTSLSCTIPSIKLIYNSGKFPYETEEYNDKFKPPNNI